MTKYDYSLSARRKLRRQSIKAFLRIAYPNVVKDGDVGSVFGFREFCGLYGGRSFIAEELSEEDIYWMYDNGIGYRIPIQTLLATHDDYVKEKPFLEKYHREGNTVIVVRPDLAEWIRNDFPKYKVEGSFIRRYNSIDKIVSDLSTGLYDTVVPDPAIFAKDYELLNKLPKDKVRLFVNMYCDYDCKRRTCYQGISISHLKKNMPDVECCHDGTPTEKRFDVNKYKELGFTQFKEATARANTAFLRSCN